MLVCFHGLWTCDSKGHCGGEDVSEQVAYILMVQKQEEKDNETGIPLFL